MQSEKRYDPQKFRVINKGGLYYPQYKTTKRRFLRPRKVVWRYLTAGGGLIDNVHIAAHHSKVWFRSLQTAEDFCNLIAENKVFHINEPQHEVI